MKCLEIATALRKDGKLDVTYSGILDDGKKISKTEVLEKTATDQELWAIIRIKAEGELTKVYGTYR
jgi:hypothetical protein